MVFFSSLDAASCRAVHRPRKTSRFMFQDLRRAVALVHVQVDDEHPRIIITCTFVERRHREVVVNRVAGAVRAVGVMGASS